MNFLSNMLTDVKTRYPKFERNTLDLRVVVKKLHPNSEAHTIVSMSSYPIKAILHKHDASGRLLKCAVKMSEFDIMYCPRSAIKGQVLADFIVELSNMSSFAPSLEPFCILETDGSSKSV